MKKQKQRRLVGRVGTIQEGELSIPVKIISVAKDKICHDCKGPWGTTMTTKEVVVDSRFSIRKGLCFEGCLSAIKLRIRKIKR